MQRRFGRRAAAVLGATATLAGMAVYGGARYIVTQLTRPQPLDPMADFTFTPWELGVPWEDVVFAARDGGYEVRGWWLLHPNADRVIIACPGYRGNKSELLGIGTALWRAGYTVLMVDFRGHGAQRGEPVTLAFREVHDFLGAVDYVTARAPGAQIGAIGFSMGAAVVIQGAARESRVQVVVADSPFATHRDVVAARFRSIVPLVPPKPFLDLADPMLGRRAGYRFDQVEPLREIAAIAPRPILLIHSTGDQVIPYQHSIQLYEAAGEPKELWLVENVPHCAAYFIDRPAYCCRVAEFFGRAMDPTPTVKLKRPAEVRGIERAMD
jgi:uncharacterized protein